MSTYNANKLYMVNCKTLSISKFNISYVGPFENEVNFYRIVKSTMKMYIIISNICMHAVIFASQGFLIRTASHKPLAYCAIKSRDFFLSRDLLSFFFKLKIPYYNVPGARNCCLCRH